MLATDMEDGEEKKKGGGGEEEKNANPSLPANEHRVSVYRGLKRLGGPLKSLFAAVFFNG